MLRMKPALAIALLGLTLFAAEPSRHEAQKTTTERVNFAPGGTIRLLDAYGCVSVEGWDNPEVEVAVTRVKAGLYSAKERAAAEPNLEKITVKLERRSDRELVISTTFPRHEGWLLGPLPPKIRVDADMEYVIRVPRNSHVAIHHKDGDVLIREVTGEIEASSRSGDIVVMLPDSGKYAIDARVRLGTVYSDFGDPKHTAYLVGEKFANGTGQRVFLRMGLGGISIQHEADAVSSQSGDLKD
jgi:hypothetical protein